VKSKRAVVGACGSIHIMISSTEKKTEKRRKYVLGILIKDPFEFPAYIT
jgi:hypothetical protein